MADQVLEVNDKFKYETDSLKKEGVSPFPWKSKP
jgi:hypothetical protein